MDGSARKDAPLTANQTSDPTGEPGSRDTLPISTEAPSRFSRRSPGRDDNPDPSPDADQNPNLAANRDRADLPARVGDGGGSGPVDPTERGDGRGRLPRGVGATLVIGILVVAGALALNLTAGALDRLNPFRNGVVQNRTVDRSGPVVLKAISDLGDFRAASGYYELVVDVEKDVKPVPSFLAGERVLFIAAGTVEAGVDLRTLGAGAIVVNDDRTSATITLPAPTLSAPNVNVERSYIYSRQRGLIDRLKDAVGDGGADQQELYALAAKRLAEAASQTGELNTRAQANTRSMMEGLLRSLGFTDVTIKFSPPEL